jgi:hypothetical protein
MEYKVLVKIYVPQVEQNYEAYIPINKTIAEVSLLIIKMINGQFKKFPKDQRIDIVDRNTGLQYPDAELVRNLPIKNGTELVIVS